jgi:hypothetical protein
MLLCAMAGSMVRRGVLTSSIFCRNLHRADRRALVKDQCGEGGRSDREWGDETGRVESGRSGETGRALGCGVCVTEEYDSARRFSVRVE